MNHYKELNKELVQQLQSMKIQLNDYKTEIINLKAQLSQQYEDNIILKKKCFNKAIKQCKDLIEILEPESEILKNFDEYGETTRLDQQSTPPTNRRSSSRSAELSEEIRRSSSIINSRQSINSLSPVPSRGSDETYAMQNTTATPSEHRYAVIREDDEDIDDTETMDDEEETNETTLSSKNSIEDEEEDDTETVNEVEESNETNTIEINTITTITTDDGDESRIEIINHRNVLGDISNTKKTNTKKNISSKTSQIRHEDCTTTTLKSMDLTEINSESPIQVRGSRGNCCYNTRSISMHSVSTGEEDFTHFVTGFSSSTPNSRKNSRHDLVVQESTKTSPRLSKSLSLTSTRPKRSCRPTNLKEPSVGSKLRNGTCEKSLNRKKK